MKLLKPWEAKLLKLVIILAVIGMAALAMWLRLYIHHHLFGGMQW